MRSVWTQSKLCLLDYCRKMHFTGLRTCINNFEYIPDLGLLLRLGGGYNAGFPTGLLFESWFSISFLLMFTMCPELWGRAWEALRTHNSGNVLLSTLPSLCNSLWYYPVSLLLLVVYIWLHLTMCSSRCLFLWRGAGRWWGWWRRGGGWWWAALHWRTEDPYLATRTIHILSGLKDKEKITIINIYSGCFSKTKRYQSVIYS